MATTNVNYTLPNSSSPLSIGYYSDSPTDTTGPTRNLIGACTTNFSIKKEETSQLSHFSMQLSQCRSPEDIHLEHSSYGMGIGTPPDSPKHKPTTLQIADSPGFSPPSSTMDMLVSPTLCGNPNSTSPILNGSNINSPSLGPCLICGDKATGNHFGVLSCEACKSFFRRSVRSNARYCCRNSRDCTVEKHTRNRCQYCRFQKCLQMGMKKEAVQEERVSSRYPPNDKRLKITGLINSMSPYCSPYCSPICTPSGTPVGTPLASPYNSPYSTPVSSPKPTRHSILHNDDLVTPAIEALNLNTSITVPMLMAADMMSGDSGAGVPIDVSQPASFEEVCESAKTQLLNIIEWAKRIHPFMQLPMDDRMILIKNSWIELLSLRLAFRYVPLDDVLVLGSGKIIQRNQLNDLIIGKITGRILDELVFWFKALKVDKAEFCCLKTILLFNPDARGLSGETKSRVSHLQQDTLVSLENYIVEHYATQVSRLGKILLRLPALRDITTEVHSYLMKQNSSGQSKIDPFLLDMANQNV